MKQQPSIRQALDKKSSQVAMKITIPLFFVITLLLVSLQIQQKSKIVSGKIDIDRAFIVDALKIGDLFFITKYVSAFVDSGSTPFCGVVNIANNNWVAYRSVNPESRDGSEPEHQWRTSFFETQIPVRTHLADIDNQKWRLAYTLTIHHSLFLIALLASVIASLFVMWFLRRTLASTSTYFTTPLENLVGDLNTQKEHQEKSLETPKYHSDHRFQETDRLVEELDSLIHEIKDQQEKLKETEVLKALNQMSRQVSHDIQSPIGALKVASQAAGESKSAKLIGKAVTRIEQIVADLTATHANKNKLNLQVFDLGEIIAEIIDEKRVEYKGSDNPQVTIKYAKPSASIKAKIHPSDFARAISNVINNGIEAVENKPAIIHVTLTASSDHIKIDIKDNGKGIPEDMINKVLERGFSNGKPNGSGTGLSFASEVISWLGGTVSLESKENISTNISLSIPVIDN